MYPVRSFQCHAKKIFVILSPMSRFLSDIEQMLSILLHFFNLESMHFGFLYMQEVDL